MPLLRGEGNPLGVKDLGTHTAPLDDAPMGYEIFQKKQDGAIKVVLQPQPFVLPGRGAENRSRVP
jgi:hypothetical protein